MTVIAWLLLVWFTLSSAVGDALEPVEPPESSGATESSGSPGSSGSSGSPPAVPVTPEQAYPRGLEVADTDEAIEQRFLTRSPLPTCGVEEVGEEALNRDAPAPYDAACLQQALEAGEGAESVVLLTRLDGGRTISYLRLNPGGPVEILIDRRGDPTEERAWGYQVCEPPRDLSVRPCAQ